MKTSELTGAALDWAVAKCEGEEFFVLHGKVFIPDWEGVDDPYLFCPSGSYNDGYPIVERERIELRGDGDGGWIAYDNLNPEQRGLTPLTAAMRCYVAGQLGEEVEIPNELKEGAE